MSMNSAKVKEYLKEDVERIERLLEEVGCHMLWRTGDEVRGAPPNGRNHTAVSVNTETLFCRVYGEGETFRGDIFQLIGLFRNEEFGESFRFTRNLFGLSGKFTKKQEKHDPLQVFKNIRKRNRVIEDIRELEIPKFGREAISDFIMLPHMKLFHEGITTQTQEIFKICYDPITDRIIFPHFAYDDINAIVGITGRTLKSAEEMKELLIPKYWNFIKNYKKSWNLYGFSHSLPYIIENNMIIIFEAEKSVLKHWSQTRNNGFSVAVGGHEISPVQLQIIMQNTPSEVEIVIAFDKDVDEEHVIKTGNMFKKYRKTSYIWDSHNILEDKDAPIDRGVKVFNHLLKWRKVL